VFEHAGFFLEIFITYKEVTDDELGALKSDVIIGICK